MEIPLTTTRTFTQIAATTTPKVNHRPARLLDKLAATLARLGATLQLPRMPARVAGQAPGGPQLAHTTLPVQDPIERGEPVRPDRPFPRLVRFLQTQAQVWEVRPLPGEVIQVEGARKLVL